MSSAIQPMTPLTMLHHGQRGVLRQLRAGRGMAARLSAMGLTPGKTIHVINGHVHGPLIVGVGETRLALARGMAHKLMVEPVLS